MPRFDSRRDKESEFRQRSSEENSLLDYLRQFFGSDRTSATSLPETLLEKFAPVWDSSIAPVLIREFGAKTTLYAIFYAGEVSGEIIMELWDPKSVNSKASQVFKFRGIPEREIHFFPKDRAKAEIAILDNWN